LISASVVETRRPRVNRPPPAVGADGRTFGILPGRSDRAAASHDQPPPRDYV